MWRQVKEEAESFCNRTKHVNPSGSISIFVGGLIKSASDRSYVPTFHVRGHESPNVLVYTATRTKLGLGILGIHATKMNRCSPQKVAQVCIVMVVPILVGIPWPFQRSYLWY
jgi:hypothetical protein